MNRLNLTPYTPSPARLLQSSRGILFDMDGVLIDSEPAHQLTLVHLSERLGRRFSASEANAFKGMTEESTARRLMNLFPGQQHSLAELVDFRLKMYHELFEQVTTIEGAHDFVRQSNEQGYAIALATSSVRPSQQRVFQKFGLDEYFHAIITGNDVANGKPHPEPYLKAAAELGLNPEECVVIEDSVNGVRSGKAAGCRVIGLTTSFPQVELREAGADFTVNSFRELASAIS